MNKSSNEVGAIAVEYLASALDVGVAFLQANYPRLPSSDPLDFGFFWDPSNEGRGDMAKRNLAEEMLDVFVDNPGYFRPAMPAAISALRKLADQIEAIYAEAPIVDEVWPKNEIERDENELALTETLKTK